MTPTPAPPEADPNPVTTEPAAPGFLGTVREMAWAFFGVRDQRNYERTTRAKPAHIIAAGILLTAVTIGALVLAVRMALRAVA